PYTTLFRSVVLDARDRQCIGLQRASAPRQAGTALDKTHQPTLTKHCRAFQATVHGPRQRLEKAVARRQRTDLHHVQAFQLQVIRLGATQAKIQALDLGAMEKALVVVDQVVIGETIMELAKIRRFALAAADAD